MPNRGAVIVLIAALHPQPAAAGANSVAFNVDREGAVVVPVTIGTHGPFSFLLDTGASHSVISSRLASQLGLPFVAKTQVTTSTGSAWRPVVRLETARIGAMSRENLLASVVSPAQLSAAAGSIDGVLGQDFLRVFNYTLDYRQRRLAWDAGRPANGVTFPLVERAGRLLAEVPVAGRMLLLVPDSGSNAIVLYERPGQLAIPMATSSAVTIRSLSGEQSVRAVKADRLTFGTITMRHQTVAVIPREAGTADEGDGLLPLHLFASVAFDARERRITLIPQKLGLGSRD